MKLLVIGGSYFLGKHFVRLACKEHEVTVYNRGNMPLTDMPVEQLLGDRHDADALRQLAKGNYDVVVDFCAYGAGDIAAVFEALSSPCKQYIFISTVDVYERGLDRVLDENAPFETRDFGGQEGAYILGKVSLEQEIVSCCRKYGARYTTFRPAILYGPDNYAPREGIYFHWISQAGQILHPVDATGEFQFAYVEDVARAILRSIGNEKAYDEAFNLAEGTLETYESFADALAKVVSKPFEKVSIPVAQVISQGIPLPFPLTREESNRYDGTKALALIGAYQSLEEGLIKTLLKYDNISQNMI